VNFLSNSIGFLLNDVYCLNLSPWPSKPCTLVVRYISDLLQHHEPTRSMRSSSSHQLSVSRFSVSAPRVLISLPVSIHSYMYFQTSPKDILLSVTLPLLSCPPCLEYLYLRALICLRLWRYINNALTYLLTYLFCMISVGTKMRLTILRSTGINTPNVSKIDP